MDFLYRVFSIDTGIPGGLGTSATSNNGKLGRFKLPKVVTVVRLEYWHQRADERHSNPPQGNQELLVVTDKVGRPQVSLG